MVMVMITEEVQMHILFLFFKEIESCKFDVNNIILPTTFSKRVMHAIALNQLGQQHIRAAFLRECVAYFEKQLPRPTMEQFSQISKKICDEYPVLKDLNRSKYWVSSVT